MHRFHLWEHSCFPPVTFNFQKDRHKRQKVSPGIIFYLKPGHPIFSFRNVLHHCTKPGPGWLSLALLPPTELHGLPHVTLPVTCYRWPTYLIYFYGAFFWNNKKNVLEYLPQEKEGLPVLENGRAPGPWFHSGETTGESGPSRLCPQLWFSLSLERAAEFIYEAS